jgi:hypothetical protein
MKKIEKTETTNEILFGMKPVGFILLIPLLFLIQNSYSQVTVPYTTSGTYTFTVPSGVSSITVECWGGGGAGGGVKSNGNYGGAGGAGGAYASKVITVTPGSNYTVTVGKGGNGGTGDGPSGGDSWFGSTTTVLAKGGDGGGGDNGSPGLGTSAGSIGSTVYKGGDGIDGYYYYGSGGGGAGSTGNGGSVSTITPWLGGSGTSAGGGNGGDGIFSAGIGNPGLAAGGGGSGAYTTSKKNYSGGDGADGQVLITYSNLLPTISGFTPSGGCANATSVVITGTNFTGATAVTFGGTNAASYAVNSSTQITATPASGTTGQIQVTTPQGTATSSGTFTVNTTPFVSSSVTPSCVGGSSGTISVSASGGGTPYTYSLNGGSYQSSSLFTGLASGTYSLNVKNNTGCIASATAIVSDYSTSSDNPNTAGSNTWTGHAYDGTNFSRYIGYFSEAETFDENFGGNATCFDVTSSSGTSSIYTETFSVAFKMNSTRKGLYVADLGSDDGSRLTVDGTLIYNNWSDQAYSTKPRVLMNLSGSSSLNFEFYENGGANEASFKNLTLVLANTLSSNTTQNICLGNAGSSISGDVYGTLPSGISKSGTGYQWTYSTTPGGTRTNISGATAATFTPNTSSAPFNTAGTYYVYRNAILTSTNNTGYSSYTATNESNAATITINALPSATISYSGTPFCKSLGTGQPVTQTGTSGGTYSASPAGLTINSGTGAITPSTSTAGTYTVTYTMAASGGCSAQTATTSVTITTLASATISYSGTPFCTSLGTAQSVTRTGTPGGTYSASPAGLTINSGTGAITPSTSTAGTYTVTYTMTAGGCSAQTATTSVTITALPSATISYSGTPFCTSLGTAQPVSQTGTTGGTYSASPAGLSINSSTGAITPSTSTAGTYTVTYTMAASGGCSAQTTTTSVTVSASPSATISYSGSPYCYNTGNANVTFSGTTGGTYSITPAGANINSNNGKVNLASATPGTYTVTYTVTSSGGCTATTTTPIEINPNTWVGNANSNWNNSGNWAATYTAGCPDVTILSGVPYQPILSSQTIAVNNLIINSGASLTLTNSTLQVAGTITNSGTLDATDGTIEMNGASAQTIAGSMFYNNTIKNLIASNDAGLSVSSTAGDTLKISGGLTFGNSTATLNTGDNLDFLSTNSGTAYLGVVGSGNTITGKAIVDRHINIGTGSGQHAKAWEFLAAPTVGQTIKQSWMENGSSAGGYGIWLTGPGGTAAGFDASSPGVAIKNYNSTTNGWDAVANTGTQINNANGYMVFIRGDRTVNGTTVTTAKTTILRSKGNLITGTQSAISVLPDHYQAIANPYASPVDFTQLSRLDGVDDLFYAWDPYLYGTYGYGGYETLSASNGWVPVPGGTSAYPAGVAHSTIQSGQAFFVHATTNTSFVPQNPTISISENAKVSGSSNVNFARVASRVASPERQFLRTDLFISPNPGAPIADGNAVAFDNSFSNKVDGNDALKLMNSGENFGLKREGKVLAVEAKAPVTSADTLFYTMTNMRQQTYQLRIVPVNMQSDNVQAFLIDQFLNISTALSLSDTNLVNFSVTSNAASKAANRFSVVFRQMAALPVTLTSVRATAQNNDILVEWATQNESGMLQYEVEKSTDGNNFQAAGVVTAQNSGTANYQWTDSQPSTGTNYYRIRMVSKDGSISYSQVVKLNFGKITPVMEVAPNPILNGTIHLVFKNEQVGNYNIVLTNLLGQVILSKTIMHTEVNGSATISGGTVNKGVYQLSIIKPNGDHEVIKVVY